ncbi:MAG: exodeoxyribonuclease V subunit gamma [Clostridia bacterium]|nr:exodeoxyribonuclease V subunit gamma [Clostridia bacterium]
MADFRIITGRAGSGKSSYCIKRMAEFIKLRTGEIGTAPAFLIVPEQFSVQAEKRLMKEAELPGLLIDEVLSFKRAACRVLGRCGGLKYDLLSQSGKVMLLTQAVRNISDSLEFYVTHASKPRGMEALLMLIEEFGRYGVSSERLKEIADKEDTDSLLRLKLSDLSKIYKEYRNLTSGKFYDSETLYNDFIYELPNDEMFKGAHVWIDGFNGFTSQEFDIIKALGCVCAEVNISICADIEEKILFENSNVTYKKLIGIADSCGIKADFIVIGKEDTVPPRFKNNRYLAHLEMNYSKYPYVQLKGKNTGISVCECGNRYYETEECAKKITEFIIEGYKFSDIAVVSGDLEQYKNIISSVFPTYGIQFFVDEKRQISSHPLCRYIIGILELISSNWQYLSVFSFLKTGLYEQNMQLVDKLENEILEKGIKGKSGVKGWSKYVEKCKAEIAEASENGYAYRSKIAVKLLAVKLFNDVESFREEIKKSKSVSDCCEAIIRFLIKTETYEKISCIASELRKQGRLDSADEYSRIWNIVTEVIEQADTFLGNKEIKGVNIKAQFVEDILANGFAQYKAGFIPHSAECVQIGTPERSKSLNPKILIVLGANEGVFPSTIKDNGLLTDADRDALSKNGMELSDDNKKRAFYSDFVIYTVMTTPSEKLFITYSLANSKGDAMRPSAIIRKLLKLFPDIDVERGKNGGIDFSRSGCNESDTYTFNPDTSIDGSIAEKLLGFDSERPVLSVSRINTYNGCPYSFLLQYCFNLKPRKEYKMEVTEIGSLLHGVIEKAFKTVAEDETGIKVLSYSDCSEIVDSVFDEEVVNIGDNGDVFLGTERSAYITSRIKNIAKKELKNLIEQLQFNHLKPIGFEVGYGFGDDNLLPPVSVCCSDDFTVSVQGKIDRIDAGFLRTEDMSEDEDTPAYFRVIDYKSSARNISVSDIVNGRDVQLIVYIEAVTKGLPKLPRYKDKKVVPAAAFYYAFDKANISLDKRCTGDIDSQNKENFMDGLYLAKEEAMQSLHGGVHKLTRTSMTNKAAVPEGGFEKLVGEANRNIAETALSMKAGKFPAKPISDLKACEYCDFKSVCRVNTSDPKNVRILKSVSEEDFWSQKTNDNE